jgi:zinc transporter ZupT
MAAFPGVLLASVLACGITTLGIVVIRRHEAWGRRHVVAFMGFAAGVLVTVSCLHLIPRALRMTAMGPALLLAGLLGMFLAGYLLRRHETVHDEDAAATHRSFGLVPMLGIGLHSLVDGIIHAVTFNVSVFTGWFAAAGMILHEFPEGIVTFLLLVRGGIAPGRAARLAFLAAGLSTPVGAMIAYPFVHRVGDATLGALLALSAGALLYVGASHLLPELQRKPHWQTLLWLALGILVAVLIRLTRG